MIPRKNKKKKEEEEEKETLTLSSDLTISDHFTLIISKGPAFFRLMVDGCDLRRSCLIRGNRVVGFYNYHDFPLNLRSF
ncbi:hypothetical protein SCA6_014547 [Theobroma cacao]